MKITEQERIRVRRLGEQVGNGMVEVSADRISLGGKPLTELLEDDGESYADQVEHVIRQGAERYKGQVPSEELREIFIEAAVQAALKRSKDLGFVLEGPDNEA